MNRTFSARRVHVAVHEALAREPPPQGEQRGRPDQQQCARTRRQAERGRRPGCLQDGAQDGDEHLWRARSRATIATGGAVTMLASSSGLSGVAVNASIFFIDTQGQIYRIAQGPSTWSLPRDGTGASDASDAFTERVTFLKRGGLV